MAIKSVSIPLSLLIRFTAKASEFQAVSTALCTLSLITIELQHRRLLSMQLATMSLKLMLAVLAAYCVAVAFAPPPPPPPPPQGIDQ